MKFIDPNKVDLLSRGLKCPVCGFNCVREAAANRPAGGRSWSVQCLDCDFTQIVEVDAAGKARTVGEEELARVAFPPQLENPGDDSAPVNKRKAAQCRQRGAFKRPAATQPQETAMPPKSPYTQCRCDSAHKKPVARGLCSMCHGRWQACGRPDLDDWIAAGGPTGKQWFKQKGVKVLAEGMVPPSDESADTADELAEQEQRLAAPAADAPGPPELPGAGAGATRLIVFERPLEAVQIGMLGHYLTLTEPDGKVIYQTPLVSEN